MELTLRFHDSTQTRFSNDCVISLDFATSTWSVGPTSRDPWGDPASQSWPTQLASGYKQSGTFEVKDNGVIWIWDQWGTPSSGMVPEKHNTLIIRDAPTSESDTIHLSGSVRIYDGRNAVFKDVVVPWTRKSTVGQPSLTEKLRFFPRVLRNADFQKQGVLFGEETAIAKDCKWVVIDPNRHKLEIWEKSSPTADFVTSGQALNASVFTNGPMVHARNDGNKYLLGAEYFARGILYDASSGVLVRSFSDSLKTIKRNWDRAADEVFEGPPYGDVIGLRRNINARAPQSSMHLGYFGRDSGTGFESYKIGLGDPAGLTEASGGLYSPAILNYQVTPDAHGPNQWFYWGLAPLKPEGSEGADLRDALAAYAAAGGPKPVTGLIVGLFYHSGGGGGIVQHLADIGVRDAVKLDGGDSVLLGHDKTVLWGDGMSGYKRVWMRWGFAFYPY